MFAISRIAVRFASSAATFTSSSSRSRLCAVFSGKIDRVSSSRAVCLMICSSTFASSCTTMVMREISGSSVADTVRLSILKPRRPNKDDTRASTPEWLSTRTLNTSLGIPPPPYSKIISSMVPPAGIIGSTFSSLWMRHSIHTGPFACSASANAAENSASVLQR